MLPALSTVRARQSNEICIAQENELVSPCHLCIRVSFFPSLPACLGHGIHYFNKPLVKVVYSQYIQVQRFQS